MDEPKYCPYCMSPVKDNGTCPNCGLTEGSYVPAPHHLLPGTLLQGRYLLGRVLGEGGFGITYVGRDTRLGVKIAVKEYYPVGNAVRNTSDSIQVNCVSRTTGSYERGKEKFLKEARTMGKLEKEPQIVAVKDFFEENNTAYIVMEYIEGTTLKELTAQRGGKIPADELFQMIKPLFPALQRMHDLGLIHRDISPDNLMLENGNIKLLDFGCAKEIIGGMMQSQQTQTLILKHGYSPFEQYQMSNTQGPWTDVYALGASIYYCLTGGPPPRSTDRIMNDEIVPPHKLGVKIDPRQEAVLMRALAVKSMDRYRSMKEFSAALYNEPLAEAEPEDRPIKLNNRKPRKVKQQAVKPNDLTVREGRIEVPVPENQEEPEKLFVTDEVPVTESAVDDTSGETPETPEETTPETSLSKKRLAFVIVAMVVVIVLAVTAIVLAVTGTNKSEDGNNDNVVASTTENWLPIAGVDIGSYQEGSVSYDAYTRTVSFESFYSSIGWEFSDEVYLEYVKIYFSEMYTLKLEVTYTDGTTAGTTVDTGYSFGTSLSLTLDPTKPIAHIALVNAIEGGDFSLISVTYRESGDETEEASVEPLLSIDIDITVETNGEGSAVIYWDNTELLESFCDAVSQEDAYIAVTADSAGIKLALNIGPADWQYVEMCDKVYNGDGTYTIYFDCWDIIDLVDDLGMKLSSIRCVYIDSLTWRQEIHVTGFEVVDGIPEAIAATVVYTDGAITISENGITSYLNHADFTEENMYLEITYLTNVALDKDNGDDDRADWGVGSIWSVDDNGSWLDRLVNIPSYHETNGTYAISLPELAEMFTSTGNDLNNGIVVENYATDYLLSFDAQLVTADHQISTSIDGGTEATTIDIRSVPNDGNEVTVWVNVEDGYVLTSFYAVSDGNELELTIVDCGDIYRFTMPDSDVTLYAKLVSADDLDVVYATEYDWGYDYTLSEGILGSKYADFTDESLYLCITYDYSGTDDMSVIGSITYCSADDVNYLSKDRVCNLPKHESGKVYISLKELGDMAEASGYEDGGFYFWLCVDDIEILEYSIVSLDGNAVNIPEDEHATVTTTAVTTTAPATTATPTTTATRDTITTICLWQGYVVDEIDVDYTDEDLYLEITFKLTSNENDYIYWAVGGIVPLTVEGWQDSVLTLPSYKDCKGTYRIAISELVDIITDAGYDMSDNVDIIINWWTDVNGKNEFDNKFTSVISMRVGTADELDSNPVEIASTISYPWTLEYTDGVEYENDGGVVENQWLIDGIVAGEQEEAGAFTLGKVAFITAKGEHMMEFIEAIQGENAYIEVVSYAPRSSHLTFNIQFNSDYNFLEFIPATDDPDPYIPLYTVTENDDGTITYLFSCSELLEIFEEYGYDVEEIILVSLNCEEGTVFKSFSVIQQ